jgi:hypothetical protein
MAKITEIKTVTGRTIEVDNSEWEALRRVFHYFEERGCMSGWSPDLALSYDDVRLMLGVPLSGEKEEEDLMYYPEE